MILTLDDIDNLRRGKHDPITVGALPDAVRVMLGLRLPNVQLSRASLAHINERHSDVDDFDMLHLPMAISRGVILREKRKSKIILAVYKDPESHKRYQAAMKLAERGNEIWLSSFYRLRESQLKKLLRKAAVLKDAAQ